MKAATKIRQNIGVLSESGQNFIRFQTFCVLMDKDNDLSFNPVTKISTYTCSICQEFMIPPRCTPMELPCSHNFCVCCLEQWLDRNHGTADCPVCKATFQRSSLKPCRLLLSIIEESTVYCTRSDRSWRVATFLVFRREQGCQWTGEFQRLHQHLRDDCTCAVVRCPHPGCGVAVMKVRHAFAAVTAYLRNDAYHCKCGRWATGVKRLLSEHDAQCPHRLVSCPMRCSPDQFPFRELEVWGASTG